MSLNGLEATEVNEAYQSALGEGGGWFLLKYTSRDEVGLYEKGSGGLAEAKEAVHRYEEQSPLFGFIQYRRRKVILKYIPEGTSRLLQARVTVQFQSVAEKFNPHDTVFTFATLSELRDSQLSSACSLHTASASVKSSNESLPQRGLAEITEDLFESPIGREHFVKGLGDGEAHQPATGHPISEKVNGNTSAGHHHSTPPHSASPSVTTRSPQRPRAGSNTEKDLPPMPSIHLGEDTGPRAVLDYMGFDTGLGVEGRFSSQSARPSTRDLESAYQYKPKVRLGPRPSMDSSILRPEKLDGVGAFRPVSTLPAGLKMPPRKIVSGRPKSSQAQSSFSDWKPPRQPLPPAPITPIDKSDRNISVPSNGLPTPAKTPEPKSPKMTPEKRRLMKALQIRQKQLAIQKSATGLGIEPLPAEEAITKPVSGGSIAKTIQDENIPPAESDLVHIFIRDVNREEPRNLEASPISVPETCEGPSTQASSFTEEDETHGHKNQESVAEPEHTTLEQVDIPSVDNNEQLHIQPRGQRIMNQEEQGHEAGLTDVKGSTESCQDSPQPSSPTKQSFPENEAAVSEQNFELESQASVMKDPPTTICHAPPTDDKLSAICVNKAEAVSTDGPSIGADEASEQSLRFQGTSASQNSLDRIGALEAPKSSSRGVPAVSVNSTNAHEVPLPPVDEDEEFSLSSQQATLQTLLSPKPYPKPETEPTVATSTDKHQSKCTDMPATQLSSSHATDGQHTQRHIRRQGVIPPIHRVSSPDHSEEQFLSDESFMEELKSATLQEAKPVSVSKSPIKPVFSRTESEQKLLETRASRSVSSPLTPRSRDEEIVFPSPFPTPVSSRSFSATHSRTDTQQPVPPLPKKLGVSTGISQRIKALEQLSARPSSPSLQASSPTVFNTSRKASQQMPPLASVPGRSNNSKSRPSTAYPSPSSSPETIQISPFKQSTNAGSSRPESVSVTATIIRDAKNKKVETPLNPSEPQIMDLYQSPLVVEHQIMNPPPLSPLKPPRPRYASTRSESSSSTDYKGEPSPTKPSSTRRRDSFASVRSKSSRAASENELPRTISDSSISGATTPDGTKDEKKDSKRSRLMKRMSNISSMSRRSIAQALSPSPKESPIMEHHEPIFEMPSSSVEVGDVNVQFPDTLLWKRRHMVIDGQGILVLSASKSDNNSKVVTKRYALSQFRTPYVPDQDRQELPNSVLLDFIDGSTLQCACEHPQGQADVLLALTQAHSLWQSR
ncbi:hypothetical protein N7G274_000174 [Stereocaulon virgatum]|uniref:ADF-H domain-containing protein n=1 Tax=Stereocaulon virgatum TaxID=373712 RepID=A0ABR4AXR4_9LECA